MKTLFVGALLFTSLTAIASQNNTRVIYGEDNRKDVYEVTNQLYLEVAEATAAQIPANSLQQVLSGEIQITGRTLIDRNICAKERFSAQISAARCSGFLVADDLLVTAGHCIKDQTDCNNYSWVFDYKISEKGQISVRVATDDVFKCSKIVARALDAQTLNDFALIKLNKKVVGRKPLEMRKEGTIALGTEVAVIGYPSGLAAKIADGAKVRDNKNPSFFVANTDTYGGNSGSPVIDSKSGLVEGILVRGEQDYIYDYELKCSVSKVCASDACRGEDITKVVQLDKYFSQYID